MNWFLKRSFKVTSGRSTSCASHRTASFTPLDLRTGRSACGRTTWEPTTGSGAASTPATEENGAPNLNTLLNCSPCLLYCIGTVTAHALVQQAAPLCPTIRQDQLDNSIFGPRNNTRFDVTSKMGSTRYQLVPLTVPSTALTTIKSPLIFKWTNSTPTKRTNFAPSQTSKTATF